MPKLLMIGGSHHGRRFNLVDGQDRIRLEKITPASADFVLGNGAPQVVVSDREEYTVRRLRDRGEEVAFLAESSLSDVEALRKIITEWK